MTANPDAPENQPVPVADPGDGNSTIRDHRFEIGAGPVTRDGQVHSPDLVRLVVPRENALGLAMAVINAYQNLRPDQDNLVEIPLQGELTVVSSSLSQSQASTCLQDIWYEAEFVPGHDSTADSARPAKWDCTRYFSATYTLAERTEILTNPFGSILVDRVRQDPEAPEWVRQWKGGFEMFVRERRRA